MKWPQTLAWLVVIAVAANVVTLWALPWVVNRVVLHKVTDRVLARAREHADSTDAVQRAAARVILARGGKNVAIHVPPVTAASRAVVRPSPDLLYTACVFDVSKHPLRVHAVAMDGYVSVSAFGPDTANFFVREVAPGAEGVPRTLDLILVHGAVPTSLPPNVTVVRAPAARGLVLFRTFVRDAAAVPRLRETVQLKQSCSPLDDGETPEVKGT